MNFMTNAFFEICLMFVAYLNAYHFLLYWTEFHVNSSCYFYDSFKFDHFWYDTT